MYNFVSLIFVCLVEHIHAESRCRNEISVSVKFLFSRKIRLHQNNKPKLESVYLLSNYGISRMKYPLQGTNLPAKLISGHTRAGHRSIFGSSR